MQIDGYFNLSDEPVVELDVGSSRIELLVDTGFNGSLMIPSQLANRLDLQFEGSENFQTATEQVFWRIRIQPNLIGSVAKFE